MLVDAGMKIPAGKSKVFFLKNDFPGLTLFEPGLELPEGLQGVPTLSCGPRIAVQLDNHSERDILLSPHWSLGQVSCVQLVVKAPVVEGQLPEVPQSLSDEQQVQLKETKRFHYTTKDSAQPYFCPGPTESLSGKC